MLHKRAIPIPGQARIWFGLTSGLGMPGMPGAIAWAHAHGSSPTNCYIYTYRSVVWHEWGSVATARPTRVINAHRYGYIIPACFDRDPTPIDESALFYQRNYAANLIPIRCTDTSVQFKLISNLDDFQSSKHICARYIYEHITLHAAVVIISPAVKLYF